MRQVNKDKSKTIAREASSWAKDAAFERAKKADNQIYDILIEAGILKLSIRGKYQIETDNYFGSFNVASIPADTGFIPADTGLPEPTSRYNRS